MGAGNCLGASFDIAVGMVKENPNIRIVHGECDFGRDDMPLMFHAFVEDVAAGVVYDEASQHDEPIRAMPCQEYYDRFGFVDNFKRYTVAEYFDRIDERDGIEFFDIRSIVWEEFKQRDPEGYAAYMKQTAELMAKRGES